MLEDSGISVPDLSDIYYPDVVYGSLIGRNFTSVAQITGRISEIAAEERANPKVAKFQEEYGVDEVYISVGYMHEIIEDYFNNIDLGVKIHFIVEDEPFDTNDIDDESISSDKK